MSKLLIPANKLAVLIKFSLYDIIAFKKFNELYKIESIQIDVVKLVEKVVKFYGLCKECIEQKESN